jgi:hypothetical protein
MSKKFLSITGKLKDSLINAKAEYKVRMKKVPGYVKMSIVIKSTTAIIPFAGLCMLFFLMTHGTANYFLWIGISLIVVLAILIAVRIYFAGGKCREYEGIIIDWKKDDSLSGRLSILTDAGSVSTKRIKGDQSAFLKAQTAYYYIYIETLDLTFLVPIMKTNDPLPIKTKVNLWASESFSQIRGGHVFDSVFLFDKPQVV